MEFLSRHVAFSRIMDFVEGRLPPAAATDVGAHIAGCARCSDDRSFVEQTIGEMRTYELEDAPAPVIARAVRLLPLSEPAPSPLRRLFAVLTFDSGQMQPALAMRSGQSTPRQVLLEADGYDLDLRIVPEGPFWAVSGQVLAPEAGGRIELRGVEMASATLNSLGEFKLNPLPAGSYALDLQLAGVRIEYAPLELGQ